MRAQFFRRTAGSFTRAFNNGRHFSEGPIPNMNPRHFRQALQQINKFAFVASASAVAATGLVMTGAHLAPDEFDQFMQEYGNRIFLEMMAIERVNTLIREVRNAEILHHGILFQPNEQGAVFYRGMTPDLDDKDPDYQQKLKAWQDGIVASMTGTGFSPLLWLTRPSATRQQGLNFHPHDGNSARANLPPDTPPSWSAGVMAMTCNFATAQGYSTLGQPNGLATEGCFMLVAPKDIIYLSSTDVRSRHHENVGHEFEVIAPHIDSSEVLALLFVESGKITRVEINDTIKKEKYSIDVHLVDNLMKTLVGVSPEVQAQVKLLVDTLKSNPTIDLIEEFNSRFHESVDELIAYTWEIIKSCNQKIQDTPGLFGQVLRALQRENAVRVRSREEVAQILQVPLEPSVEPEHSPEMKG